jgi:hypothetical protein
MGTTVYTTTIETAVYKLSYTITLKLQVYTITILPYKIEERTLPYRPLDDVRALRVAPALCRSR